MLFERNADRAPAVTKLPEFPFARATIVPRA
jgi:hypothetical protein